MRNRLVAEARSWVGTPYRKRGRIKGRAADCIFFEEVFRAVTGYAGRHVDYSAMPRGRVLERFFDVECTLIVCASDRLIRFDDLLPARMVIFVKNNPDEPQHVGMIADHPKVDGAKTLIHAIGNETNGGKVVEHTLCTAESFTGRGEVRSMLGRLWKVYDGPGVIP